MRKISGKVAFTVTVCICTITKICITVIANMLAIHAIVPTFHLLPTFVAPEISVIIVTVCHLPVTFIAIMLGCVLVNAIDDSVTTVATVVLVLVYMVTNEFSATSVFITVSVVIMIDAPGGNPHATEVTGVITTIILVGSVIRIFFTFGFLTTDVADRISILVDMIITSQLREAFIAYPVAVFIHACVRHPRTALITEMITVVIDVVFANLLHTPSRTITFVTSSVVVPVTAKMTQPKTAIIASVIPVFVSMHIVELVAPLKTFSAVVAYGIFVFINMSKTGHLIFTNVAKFVAIIIYAKNRAVANVAPTVVIFVGTHIIETSIADTAFV